MELNTQDCWPSTIKWLHWGMAFMILSMMVLGWLARSLPISPLKVELFFWHKSFGIVLLMLVLVRLALRLVVYRPPWPVEMPRWERITAGANQVLLYLLMLITPLSGWVINSAAKFPFKVFGIWNLPRIVPVHEPTQLLAQQVHMICFLLFSLALLLHIAGALRHHFILHDRVLLGMLPRRFRRESI